MPHLIVGNLMSRLIYLNLKTLILAIFYIVCISSVVECLTRDQGVGDLASRRHCVVVLEQDTFIPALLVLVQPRNTRPCLTERLLMGLTESNQTNKTNMEANTRNPDKTVPSLIRLPLSDLGPYRFQFRLSKNINRQESR